MQNAELLRSINPHGEHGSRSSGLSGEAMQEEDGPTAAAGFDVLNMPGLMPKDEPSAEAAEVEIIEEDSLFREPDL